MAIYNPKGITGIVLGPHETSQQATEQEIKEKGRAQESGRQHVYLVGASEYSGFTHSCPRGPKDVGGMGFAELGMGTMLGGLPCGTKLQIATVGGKGPTLIATKVDIGLGGAPVQGHARRIDLYVDLARALKFSGTELVRISRVDGKPINGPGHELSQQERSGAVPVELPNPLKWGDELAKVLAFLLSASGWNRILKIIGGMIILLFALNELMKIGPGVNPAAKIKRALP